MAWKHHLNVELLSVSDAGKIELLLRASDSKTAQNATLKEFFELLSEIALHKTLCTKGLQH